MATVAATSHVGRLHRGGELWEAVWARAPFSRKDPKGLHYLIRILTQRGGDVHVLDLASGPAAPPAPAAVDPNPWCVPVARPSPPYGSAPRRRMSTGAA